MKTLLLFLLFCSPVFARIGETRAQCEARYGPPVEVKNEGEITVHQKAEFRVECTYFEGKCDGIRFSKMTASPEQGFLPLTEADQKMLMEANSGGKAWAPKLVNAKARMQMWKCGELQAAYDEVLYFFIVHNEAYGVRFKARMAAKIAEEKAAKEKAAKDKADGKGSLKDF